MEIDDYIKCFMGPIHIGRPFGIALWANRVPGRGFLMHSILSEICTHQKPCIVIDDYLPMAIFHRSPATQREVNGLYFEALSDNCSAIHLMSSIMESAEYFRQVVTTLDRITFLEFVRCLPEKKLANGFENTVVSEILHTAAELFVFEYLKSIGLKTMIIPQFSQAIVSLHRNISPAPLSAIVTSGFAAETDFKRQSQELWHLADEILTAITNQTQEKGIERS